jgi:threonine synthase
VYYFYSALALGGPGRKVSYSVPTGNFGDIYAGYLARLMGLPIEQLIIATNANDILHRCISANDHSRHPLQHSLSPSMDIMVSSNFERLLLDLYDRNAGEIKQLMTEFEAGADLKLSAAALTKARDLFASYRMDDQQMLATLSSVYHESEYLVDPHTAIGVAAARSQRSNSTTPVICLATAHPAKFPEAITQAGQIDDPQLPDGMKDLFERKENYHVAENEIQLVHQYMIDSLNSKT